MLRKTHLGLEYPAYRQRQGKGLVEVACPGNY
jgi:hypothetical protein